MTPVLATVVHSSSPITEIVFSVLAFALGALLSALGLRATFASFLSVVVAVLMHFMVWFFLMPFGSQHALQPMYPFDLRTWQLVPRNAIGALVWYWILPWFAAYGGCVVRDLPRRKRRRQNRCVACGYSLRGSPSTGACPECGLAY